MGEGCEVTLTCFCFSCYQSWDKLHEKSHEFELSGELEFVDGPEVTYNETVSSVGSGQDSDNDEGDVLS